MALIITLVLLGLVLILAEILVVPGVGVAGILGVLSMGGASFYAFHELGDLAGGIVTGVNALLLVVFSVYVLRAKTWKRMTLETRIDSKAVNDDSNLVAVGDLGKAVTRLAPMGMARFGGHVIEVKAVEGIIDAGTDVVVELIEEGRIHVSLVRKKFSEE